MPGGRHISEKYVRDHLSPAGKRITGNSNFKPYNMRHTFATFLYQYTKNIKKVSKRLGHTKTANTDKYVGVAEDLEEQFNGKNLFNLTLKPHNFCAVGGKQNKQITLSYAKNKAQPKVNYSRWKGMGLAESKRLNRRKILD